MVIIKIIWKSISSHSTFLLFLFLFTLFFSSSVGIINSGDTPQFFTTESILHHHTLDMSMYADDPHYFVWPDYIHMADSDVNMRGFMTSIISIPVHLIAKVILPFIKTHNFDSEVITDRFAYELAVTSMYTLFSVIGLLFIRIGLGNYFHSFTSNLVTLFLGIGSYVWKYSTYYARHGQTVFFIGLLFLCLSFIENKKQKWVVPILMLVFILTFGVDTILFVSFVSFFLMYLFVKLIDNSHHELAIVRKYKMHIFITLFYIIFLAFINVFVYGKIIPFDTIKFSDHYFSTLTEHERSKVVTSANVIYTIPTILFNFGKLPEKAYSHLSNLPEEIKVATSYYYLKKYNYFGLVSISPFVLLSLFSLFINKKSNLLLFFSFWVAFIYILLNATFFTFYGGNQYDVRYFYPSILCLAYPIGIVFERINKLQNKWRMALNLFSWLCFLYSVIMGWFGVISMFKSSLSGERKVWVDVINWSHKYFLYTPNEYLNATFPNRENIGIPIVLSFGIYFMYLIAKRYVRFLYIYKPKSF